MCVAPPARQALVCVNARCRVFRKGQLLAFPASVSASAPRVPSPAQRDGDRSPGLVWTRRTWIKAYLVSTIIWILLGLLVGVQAYSSMEDRGDKRPLVAVFKLPLVRFQVYNLLTPPVIFLTTLLPLAGGYKRRKHLAAHVAGLVVFSFAYVLLRLALMPPYSPVREQYVPRTTSSFFDILFTNVYEFLMMYVLIVAIASAIDLYFHNENR